MTPHEYNFQTFAGFHNDLTSIERLIAGQPLALSTSAFYSNSEQRTTFIWLRQVGGLSVQSVKLQQSFASGAGMQHGIEREGMRGVLCNLHIFRMRRRGGVFVVSFHVCFFSLFRFIEQNIDMKIGFRFSCDRATNCASQRSFSCSCSTKRD